MSTMSAELELLRARLEQAEQTLAAIRNGEVDAVLVRTGGTEQVYTLKSADRAYRLMVEQMNEGAATLGADGTVLYANRRFAAMAGRSLESTIGSSLLGLVAPSDIETLRRFLSADPLPAAGIEVSLGLALPRTPARLSASRLTGETENCICVIALDLSDARRSDRLEAMVAERSAELERTSASLRLSERLVTIGTLSAGLGHDLGNLLLPVRARLDVLEAAGVPEANREDLQAIRSAVEYLQRLASGLRLLAVDPEQGRMDGPIRLDTWWNDCFPVLRDVLPSGVTLEGDIGPDLPMITISRPALTQAVFNLVQNAGDALRARGHGAVKVKALAAGDTVLVSVADDGPGMSEDVRRRCLEPYFTTKPRSLSTGMGLPLVHGIVTRAGGTVQIESRPGQGTTFLLSFPAAQGSADATDWAPAAAVTVSTPRTAAYISAILRSLGCEIRGSADNDPALWVVDAGAAGVPTILSFLERRPDARAVVTGESNGLRHPRVHRVPTTATPAQFRVALAEAVSLLRKGDRAAPLQRLAP